MKISKKDRHNCIMEKLKKNPFLKDEELARVFGVSVATIRFDRAELGIAQYRDRLKNAAEEGMTNTNAVGKLLDLNVYHDGVSVLNTDESMLFEGTDIVKSSHIYTLAENLAMSVIDAKSMLVSVANIKYTSEVHAGETLVARSQVIREMSGSFTVHIFIKVNMREVFRGKFKLKVIN